MNLHNMKQACQQCLHGNNSPSLFHQLELIFGKHQNFSQNLTLIKQDNKIMTCFFLMAKKKINQGTYFNDFFDCQEIIKMVMNLSDGFSFQNASYANFYLQFLGFLTKEYFYSAYATDEGISTIFEFFIGFPPVYQLKIMNSILDNIQKFKSVISAYANFWKTFPSMISKYGNILIQKIQLFLQQTEVIDTQQLPQIFQIFQYFFKDVFEDLQFSEDKEAIVLINTTKVDIVLWIDYLCKSWFHLNEHDSLLQIQLLNLLQKIIRTSKKFKQNLLCESTIVKMLYEILKVRREVKNKNVKSALATLIYWVIESFDESSLIPFLDPSEIITNFCLNNVQYGDLDLQSGSNSAVSVSMDIVASFIDLHVQRTEKKKVVYFQKFLWTFISAFFGRMKEENQEINFATIKQNIEVLENYCSSFAFAIYMLHSGKLVIAKQCLKIAEEENSFIAACLLGVLLKQPGLEEKQTKILQTQYFYEYFKLKDKVDCQLTKLLIVNNFFTQILNEDFVEEGEYSSDTCFLIEKEELITFEEILEEGMEVIRECLSKFTEDNEKFEGQISYALDICVFVCDKLAKRHRIVNEFPEDYQDQCNFVEIIEEVFQIVTDLYIFSSNQFYNLRKHYQILSTLLNEYDVQTIFQIFNKISTDFNPHQYKGLLQFMIGTTGALTYLEEKEHFKVFTELIINQFEVLNIQVESGEFLEVFIHFMDILCAPKQFMEGHYENLLRIQQIFHKALEQYLPQALKVPDLYESAISIYINYAQIQGINYLLKFPHFEQQKIQKDLLEEYFERISRVQHLSDLEDYACLSLNWMILFLEEKIERDEKLSANLRETTYFFSRFDRQKVRHLKSLFSHFLAPNQTIKEEGGNDSIVRIWIQSQKIDFQP